MTSAASSITNKGDVEAKGGDVTMDTKTDLGNQGAVTASQSVGLNPEAAWPTKAMWKPRWDVTMDAKTDLRNQGAVMGGQSVGLTSGQSMTNDKAVTAGQDLTMDAGTTLTNGGGLTATDGSIELTAQKGLRQNGNATAGSSITMDNQQDGALVVTGDVQSGTAATIRNKNGSITIGSEDQKGMVKAGTRWL